MNFDKFLTAAKVLGSDITKSAQKYVPMALSHDKKLANGFGCALALMICADSKVEADETIAGMHFIRDQSYLRSKDLIVDTIDFYSIFVKDLSNVAGTVDFYVMTAKMIEENLSPLDSSQKVIILTMVQGLCGSKANDFEKSMLTEIIKAL